MAEFKKLIITKKGQEALNDSISSSEYITFKQISSSSRIYTDEEILDLENLEDVKQTVDVSNVQKISENIIQIEGVIDNAELSEGYKLNTLGLIITYKGQDILYGVSSVTGEDKGAYMPQFNGKTPTASIIKLLSTISNMDSISFEISQTGNVTMADLLEVIKKFEDYYKKTETDEKFKSYYKKTETFSKEEVTSLVNAITTVSLKPVDSLPEAGETNVIYLVPSEKPEEQNVKDEYIWLDNKWECIGSTKIDLSVYDEHIKKDIYGEDGVHGFRYFEDKLQFKKPDGTWEDVETGSGITPGNVSNLTIEAGDKKIVIKWDDPDDIVVEGQTLCRWKGTKVVQKTNGYPENAKDGVVVVDNQEKNKYKTDGLEINDLENGTTYYFQLFPYSDTNSVNTNTTNRVTATPQAIPPNDVKDIGIKVGNTKVTINWTDPDEKEGCKWAGTKLVYKAGGYPESVSDGTIAVDNKVKDQYKTNGFEISSLTNGTTYYFQLFPYSELGSVNSNEANRISGTPQEYRTMTAVIDTSNSNPTNRVTYEDDATGLEPGSQTLLDFFGNYPCLFQNGVEGEKLNPNDFSKLASGGTADITSGNAGDVMICFPRRGLNITTSGTKIKVSITDNPSDANFKYYAFQRGTTEKDKFYMAAYLGYESSSKLRSLSGKKPTASKTIGQFRTLAQANGKADGNGGSGYDQAAFNQLTYLQAMFVILSKSTNSETLYGKGYTNSSNSASTNTGGANAYGMNNEVIKKSNASYLTDGKHQAKFAGIEDFSGNLRWWIDGFFCNSSRHILTATDKFNDNGSGYKDQGEGASSNISGYLSQVQGTTEKGFAAKACDGSETTYYCDYADLNAGYLPSFGGDWYDDSSAGAFCLRVDYSASYSYSYVGGRLMYL